MSSFTSKRILITGVCGTVGRELLRQILLLNPAEIIGLDNNESELFFLEREHRDAGNLHVYLGDVRDPNRLHAVMDGIDIVLHAAALKHVLLCEKSPDDAVQTNIQGVQNIIKAASANHVERVLFTSSDKAVNPTNVMGTTKLMGERLMTAANATQRAAGPIFASTRFGNVLGSRGSVIPLFKRQIEKGGPVTLTDPRMTRFIMTLESAVALVLETTFLARGGEVFITKMPVVRIQDLAVAMIDLLAPQVGFDPSDIKMEVIGSQPGEKIYEELMNDEEIRRTIELPSYFVVLPAFKAVYQKINYHYPSSSADTPLPRPYNSANGSPMPLPVLKEFLVNNNLLSTEREGS